MGIDIRSIKIQMGYMKNDCGCGDTLKNRHTNGQSTLKSKIANKKPKNKTLGFTKD